MCCVRCNIKKPESIPCSEPRSQKAYDSTERVQPIGERASFSTQSPRFIDKGVFLAEAKIDKAITQPTKRPFLPQIPLITPQPTYQIPSEPPSQIIYSQSSSSLSPSSSLPFSFSFGLPFAREVAPLTRS